MDDKLKMVIVLKIKIFIEKNNIERKFEVK